MARSRAQGDRGLQSPRAQGYGGSNRRAGANAPIHQVAGTAAAVYAGEPNSGNNVATRLTGLSANASVAKPQGTGGGKRGTSGAGLYAKNAAARAKKV